MTLPQYGSLLADLQRGQQANRHERRHLMLRMQGVRAKAEHRHYDPTNELAPYQFQKDVLDDVYADFTTAISCSMLMRLMFHAV